MAIDIVIKNGTVVCAAGVLTTDVAISGEKIVAIGDSSAFPDAKHVIDAEGKIVIPGGVDPHVHFENIDPKITESWSTDSVAAAIGGTTTVVDHALPKKGQSLMDAIKEQFARAEQRSAVDYTTRPMLVDLSNFDAMLEEMGRVVKFGIPTFFSTTWCAGVGGIRSDWELYSILRRCKELNALMTFSAVNGGIGQGMRDEFLKQGKIDPVYHAKACPGFLEEMDIVKCLMVGEATGAMVYIQQVTTKNSPDIVDRFRQKGLPVYCEANPWHLHLTDDLYEPAANGATFVCTPPLRKAADVEALWTAMLAGKFQVIGSDHCPFSIAQNEKGRATSFANIPNGLAAVEARLPLFFHEGVVKRGLSLQRFVDIVATNPAKLHGLYPQKGVLAPGSDADIVILDPNKSHSLDAKALHEGTDVSGFEGMEVTGWPVLTMLRGKVIVDNEKFLGTKGQGQFVKGKLDKEIMATV